MQLEFEPVPEEVSTHSRPKAAGGESPTKTATVGRFNSQPPEGGWASTAAHLQAKETFQLTAARRRLESKLNLWRSVWQFQLTAARRRLVPPLKPLARKACIALFR